MASLCRSSNRLPVHYNVKHYDLRVATSVQLQLQLQVELATSVAGPPNWPMTNPRSR